MMNEWKSYSRLEREGNVMLELKFTQWTFHVLIPILRRIILDEFIFATSDLLGKGNDEIFIQNFKLIKTESIEVANEIKLQMQNAKSVEIKVNPPSCRSVSSKKLFGGGWTGHLPGQVWAPWEILNNKKLELELVNFSFVTKMTISRVNILYWAMQWIFYRILFHF